MKANDNQPAKARAEGRSEVRAELNDKRSGVLNKK